MSAIRPSFYGISEEDLEKDSRRITHLMTDVERRYLDQEKISTYWMKAENLECFDNVQYI